MKTIEDFLADRRGGVTATQAITAVLDQIDVCDDPGVLIGPSLRALALAHAAELDTVDPHSLPLHGVPFFVKDNIDVADVPTTCGCPSYAYVPSSDAFVVARLRAAGAVVVGKTNLDQFATGLVGTRTPHPIPRNPLDPSLVPGGSSSGSAVGVALGLVPFSLGTDTAGSGRVPAAMCGIVGLKPSLGRLSTSGIVPAVRRFDCPSVFANSIADARLVADIAAAADSEDCYSRTASGPSPVVRRIAVPSSNALDIMQPEARDAFGLAVRAASDAGFEMAELEIEPLLAAGRLLYDGPFVGERAASFGEFLGSHPSGADPTVSTIVGGAARFTAVDAYRGEYELAGLRATCAASLEGVDAILLPTTPGVATLAEVANEPIERNAWLGTFTTFVNLLDLSALAFPLGARADGLPFGVQLVGRAWSDDALADAAAALRNEPLSGGVTRKGEIELVVVGAHLRGMPLNHQLTSRGARFLGETTTAQSYRLHALSGTVPPKPGLERVTTNGAAIVVERWAMSASAFGSFTMEVPPPLGLGSIELVDGSWTKGFICEPLGLATATDITAFGGWRAFTASLSAKTQAST